ncbi:MAG: hypothetical protein HC876_22175 [Chloroflexaceae bacterium]|nr:hypothetical protein [Chloroflexaceae bacterium]
MYLRARWYDPASGTFLGRDPFAGYPTIPYSQHPYQYGYSNPALWTDPSGEAVPPSSHMYCPFGYFSGLDQDTGRYVCVKIFSFLPGPVSVPWGQSTQDIGIADPSPLGMCAPIVGITKGALARYLASTGAISWISDSGRLLQQAGYKINNLPALRAIRVRSLEAIDNIPGGEALFQKRLKQRPGYAFQARRALHYAERGELIEIEPEIPFPGYLHPGKPDLLLSGNRFVETKALDNWAHKTSSQQQGIITSLEGEVNRYLSDPTYTLLVEVKGTRIPIQIEAVLLRLETNYPGRLTWVAVP